MQEMIKKSYEADHILEIQELGKYGFYCFQYVANSDFQTSISLQPNVIDL